MNKDLFLSKANETNCFISESKILAQLAELKKAVIISMEKLEFFSEHFLTIKEEIVKLYHQLHEGGGYILAPTHALAFDVPPGNILAMIEMFNNQEKHLK